MTFKRILEGKLKVQYAYHYNTLETKITKYLVVYAVPPAYYAHLAAFRARFYMEPEMHENSTNGGHAAARSTRAAGESGVRPLPALKENVKRVMFYC